MALRAAEADPDLAHRVWPCALQLECYGSRLGVRVNVPCLRDQLSRRSPPGAAFNDLSAVDALYSVLVSDAPHRVPHVLYRNSTLMVQSGAIDDILAALESDLHFRVALHARGVLFVHAGVVGWGGHAMVIPGRSYSGKSTLVDALVRAGATYLSDEYAVVDAAGEVHPYAKPLMLRKEAGDPRQRYPADSASECRSSDPLPVGTIIVTTYRPAAIWAPRKISAAQGLLALLNNTVLARRRSDVALPTLARAARGATVLQSRRGEADETAAQILGQHDREEFASGVDKED